MQFTLTVQKLLSSFKIAYLRLENFLYNEYQSEINCGGTIQIIQTRIN